MKQLSSNRMDFHEIWFLSIFRKTVETIQAPYIRTSITSTVHGVQYIFWILSRSVLRMKHVSGKGVENVKACSLCWITSFRKSCPLWEMWEDTVKLGRPQMIKRMHIACWIPKATNTQSGYVILSATTVAVESNNARHCYVWTYIVCFFNSKIISVKYQCKYTAVPRLGNWK